MTVPSTAKLYRAGDSGGVKQKLANAIAEYGKALTAKPGDPTITLALGRALVADGKTAESESLFRSIVARRAAVHWS
jgi:predicted Zn-dependent protease